MEQASPSQPTSPAHPTEPQVHVVAETITVIPTSSSSQPLPQQGEVTVVQLEVVKDPVTEYQNNCLRCYSVPFAFIYSFFTTIAGLPLILPIICSVCGIYYAFKALLEEDAEDGLKFYYHSIYCSHRSLAASSVLGGLLIVGIVVLIIVF